MNLLRATLLPLFFALSAKAAFCNPDSSHIKRPHLRMTITEVLQKNTTEWMKIPGVIGTGEGRSDDKPCITIFTDHLAETNRKKLPETANGYKVITQETGEIKAREK